MQIKKPLEDHHTVLQWYNCLCAYQRKHKKKPVGEIESTPATGLTRAYYGLACNLYLLEHNVELRDHLIRRLKIKDQPWEAVQSQRTGAAGLLRINTSRIAYWWFLKRVLERMAADYPDVTVELFFDDGLSDIVGQGFDAGIRLGHMIAEDMIAVTLAGPFRTVIVASEDYLSERGTPTSLRELQDHRCIQYRMTSAGNVYVWELRDGKREIQLETQGRAVVNDMIVALDLARSGHGLCYTFEPLARDDIESGALVEVMPKASLRQPGVSCYYPRRASESPKLRAFVDSAKAVFASRARTGTAAT